jgi:hypothetical protein
MMSLQALAVLAVSLTTSHAQNIRTDPMTVGPSLEVIHLFTGQWPTGIAVSSTGRKFSCFPAALDINNTYTGLIPKFQVAELTSSTTETAYPNASYNQPPGGSVNRLNVPPSTKGDPNHLLGVQSVIIDSADTLWILDTGRVQDLSNPLNPILPATIPGGPKLVNIDLTTDTIIQTIILDSSTVKPFSYLNDLRIDRNPRLSGSSGKGVAYLTDSSPEGENALVFVDLGTGKGQRYPLKETFPIDKTVPWVWGDPMYQVAGALDAIKPGYITFGADGIAISPDMNTLYFSVIGGRFLYSIPTAALRGGNSVANAQSKTGSRCSIRRRDLQRPLCEIQGSTGTSETCTDMVDIADDRTQGRHDERRQGWISLLHGQSAQLSERHLSGSGTPVAGSTTAAVCGVSGQTAGRWDEDSMNVGAGRTNRSAGTICATSNSIRCS